MFSFTVAQLRFKSVHNIVTKFLVFLQVKVKNILQSLGSAAHTE